MALNSNAISRFILNFIQTKCSHMILRFFLFLIFNFVALALGGLFTSSGVQSEWYASLQKAPWTPPGWVFGFAWTIIIICFAFYMSYLWESVSLESRRFIIILFAIQWVLNVAWNPVFFSMHYTWLALIIIVLLTIVIALFLFKYANLITWKSLYILPYFVWLLIASSLNAYICVVNR